MMPSLQLTPAAAARIYQGPHFHKPRTSSEQRKLLREQIVMLKASPSILAQYCGCIAEAIMKFKPHRV